MADEEIGGIRASITADASGFLATLRQAEAAAKAFDERYGKINVTITATLALPNQSAIRDYQRNLQAAIDKVVVPKVTPSQAAAATPQSRGAVLTPIPAAAAPIPRTATPTATAAEATVAAVPQAAPSAKDIEARNAANKAAAQTRANSRGSNAQWTDHNGVINTVHPERPTRGATGLGGGLQFGGGAVTTTIGPQEFAGRARGGDPNINFQKMQEDAARVTSMEREFAEMERIINELRGGQISDGEQVEQAASGGQQAAGGQSRGRWKGIYGKDRAYTARVDRARARGQFTEPGAPVIITRASRRAAMEAENANRPIPRPQIQVSAAAEDGDYVPPTGSEKERFTRLAAGTGMFGAEAQTEALEDRSLFRDVPPVGRRGRPGVLRTASPRTVTRRLSPEAREAAVAASEELEVGGASVEESRLRLLRAQQRTQQRAFGTTVGGLITGLFGGTQAREQQAEARKAVNEATYFEEALTKAKDRELTIQRALNREEDPEKKAAIKKDLREQQGVVEELTDSYGKAATNAERLTKVADEAAKGGLRNVAGAFTGALIGSLTFGVAMTAVTGGLEAIQKAAGPVLERMTGYQNVMAKITSTLADQSIAEHGLTGVVVAETLARSRLNAETAASISPLLEGRAASEAANKSLETQLDLFNSQIAIRNQNAQFGGADRGLFRTTGGLNILGIQTPIGGTPSTQELIARQLAGVGQTFTSGSLFSDRAAGLAKVYPLPGQPGFKDLSVGQQIATQKVVDSLDYLNNALEAGGESVLHFTLQNEAVTDAQKRLAVEQEAALQDLAPDIATMIRDAGGRLRIEGGALTPQNITRFIQAFQGGAQREDPELALTRLREQTIPARRFQLLGQAALQREGIVAQTGIQRAASPFLPFGTTIPGGIGAVSPALQGLIGPTRGLDQIRVQQINAGRVQIESLVGRAFGPAAAGTAVGQFNQIQQLGGQAAALRGAVTAEQVTLATHQYNEQLRQANLQLTDLAQLTGRVGATGGDNLGILEKQSIQYQRQNALLQIQLSTLQLEQQQRQINFQRAIAGFFAPGLTGAERAARREEAQIEADFAQRQLDIQKEILANQSQSVPLQIRIQDIQFQRDYIAARNAIGLLTEGRQVTIDTAGAEEKINQLNADIATTQAGLETTLQAAESFAGQAISDAAQFIATYKTSTETLEQSAEDFFSGISNSYATGLIDFLRRVAAYTTTYAQNAANVDTSAKIREGGNRAEGFYGQVSSPTHMLVGEAGAETVAILRNPRELTWNGGGGGQAVSLTINFNNPVVRDDADLQTIIAKVSQTVEENLGRRAAGFSGAAR